MTISFLYNGIVAVYYALMGLGTTETTESLALVLIPPGNVLRSIAEFRKTLWSAWHMASARAWFDYPVLAWLHRELADEELSTLAARFIQPFELLAPERHGTSVFLPFSKEILGYTEALEACTPVGTIESGVASGPFEAGIGCFCASLETEFDSAALKFPSCLQEPTRARTCMLAQVSLEWTTGPSFYSSWRYISGARAHGVR
jgi:hypothetical protein